MYQIPGDSKWPFDSVVGGHQQSYKGSHNDPKKVTKNCQVNRDFLTRYSLQLLGVGIYFDF